MAKIKNSLIREAKKRIKDQETQEHLQKKYHLDPNVRVVEKSNTLKFLLKFFSGLFRCVINIIVFALAFIGIVTLVYPEMRSMFFELLINIIHEVIGYLF